MGSNFTVGQAELRRFPLKQRGMLFIFISATSDTAGQQSKLQEIAA